MPYHPSNSFVAITFILAFNYAITTMAHPGLIENFYKHSSLLPMKITSPLNPISGEQTTHKSWPRNLYNFRYLLLEQSSVLLIHLPKKKKTILFIFILIEYFFFLSQARVCVYINLPLGSNQLTW